MTLHMISRNGKVYVYGAIWQQPGGRDAAIDAAQVRVFERELAELGAQRHESEAA
jgi:hypothetical protein